MSKNTSNADFVFGRAKNTDLFKATLLDASTLSSEEFPDLSLEELKGYFSALPESIQNEAMDNGLNDNLVRDDVYYFFKENPHLLNIGK